MRRARQRIWHRPRRISYAPYIISVCVSNTNGIGKLDQTRKLLRHMQEGSRSIFLCESCSSRFIARVEDEAHISRTVSLHLPILTVPVPTDFGYSDEIKCSTTEVDDGCANANYWHTVSALILLLSIRNAQLIPSLPITPPALVPVDRARHTGADVKTTIERMILDNELRERLADTLLAG